VADFGSVQGVAYIIPIAVGLLVGRKDARRRSGSVNVSRAVSRYREPMHPTSWKGNSEKFGRLLEPHSIHILASLCTTTTCSVASYAYRRRECAVAPAWDRCYAGSCIRTSENSPSTHSDE
jgi:hypothetical protein